MNINFDNDTPGQPPSTGGPGQPTSIFSFFGTSVRVQASANGIATQPVVLTAQGAVQFAGVSAGFAPVAADVVRVEATVSFDRVADGWFLDTTAGSGPVLGALVTRLRMTEFGEIQDDVTRTRVGTYSPNQPLRVRVDIDMSAREWAASIDNEFDGFQDDPVVSGLPFVNGPAVTPTVGSVLAGLLVLSGGPTAVAYDDIRAFVLPSVVPVDVDVKPGSFPNSINPRSQGVLPSLFSQPTPSGPAPWTRRPFDSARAAPRRFRCTPRSKTPMVMEILICCCISGPRALAFSVTIRQ